MPKPVTVDTWVERNERRVIEFMIRLYPDGCTMATVRSFLRGIHQSDISEGLVKNMERRGLLKLNDSMIYLTQKAKTYVA